MPPELGFYLAGVLMTLFGAGLFIRFWPNFDRNVDLITAWLALATAVLWPVMAVSGVALALVWLFLKLIVSSLKR
jgi:hypothetical protein